MADRVSDQPSRLTSWQALSAKIGRTGPARAAALVRPSAEGLRPLRHAAAAAVDGWPGYAVGVVDGTDLDGSDHRVGVRRRTHSSGLPGRLVVDYDRGSGLCSGAVASAVAYACCMNRVEPLLRQAGPDRLDGADRNFCCWAV